MSGQHKKINNEIIMEFLQEKYNIYLEYFDIYNDTITFMTKKES